MATRKRNLPIVILSLFLIGLLGFKDTGISAKNSPLIDKDFPQNPIIEYEEIVVLRESSEGCLVQNNDFTHDIPSEISQADEVIIDDDSYYTLANEELVSRVVTSAYESLGKSYSYGGIGPDSFDCSGLTYSIYLNELDIELKRRSRDQIKDGISVSREELIPGDLVFFRTSGIKISHVGLYVGDDNMIHASSGSSKVMVTNIKTSSYYNNRYVTARRIINWINLL